MVENFERTSKLILLCTIIPNSKYFLEKTLKKINENFKTSNGKVFVLKANDGEDKLVLSYNIIQEGEVKYRDILKSTFQVHRKKDNNVLYTLNALNLAIIDQCGKKDSNFKLNWLEYRNSLLLIRKDEDGKETLHRVPTVLNEIVELDKI